MIQEGNTRRWWLVGLIGIWLLTTLVYWPGLKGSYLFDDYPNLVENTAVQVKNLSWRDWKDAALSSPSHELRRPLAMLSFAANTYFTGLAPWPMKFTNLLVHLLNGGLLWGVLNTLLQLPGSRVDEPKRRWATIGITAAWLLNPINLSSVLYVVQRMEALAQVFVLAGLWLYLVGRKRMLEGRPGLLLAAVGIVGGSSLGFLCKESAALLPLYAFLAEVTLLQFRSTSDSSRRGLWLLYTVLLLIPLVAGLVWIVPRALNAAAYAGRPFTLHERLLTELRVLVTYAHSTLLPQPQQLGFYHDDIPLSQGWLSPPTTLLSALLIAAVIGAAVVSRHRPPLFSLGISWYFAAHLLTATIIPLELVFEHRNYFASIGLLLAVAALLTALPKRLSNVAWIVPLSGLVFLGLVTAMRAHEWSNPIRFAYAEAAEHPDSPRANYELGRTLVIASGYRADSKLIQPARQAFERASTLPGAGASSSAALIIVAGHMQQPAKLQWWKAFTQSLSARPPSAEDVSALQSLLDCQHKGYCPSENDLLLSAFLAALNHPHPTARLLGVYGTFAANQLGDYALAATTFEDAAELAPQSVGYRLDLVKVLLLEGKKVDAQAVLAQIDQATMDLAELQRLGQLRKLIIETPDSAQSIDSAHSGH